MVEEEKLETERQKMQVDIACVGFGPAMGGFLTRLSKAMTESASNGAITSRTMEGMPLQVMCYERADDIGFGVSGVVTQARALKESISKEDLASIPSLAPVKKEKLVYLLDPIGASRRPRLVRLSDKVIKGLGKILRVRHDAWELPFTPPFLNKHGGFVFSVGQFNQWVGSRLMGEGQVQIWPATPVSEPLLEGNAVKGVRLVDQGVDKQGAPGANFSPGMDVEALLTVVGDGPVGAVGRKIDAELGLPEGHHQRDWAIGMKMVVELPPECELEAGTVLHTFGFPEPEIFGFLYVHPERIASLGIFVPSWFDNPARTAYRYMQHWMQHPYLWRHLKGGTLRSWGAKSIQESGIRGEPHLVGDGFARIGEGSGTTNVLTNSGVDEAWYSGELLAEGVLELLHQGKDFSSKNLEESYLARRRASWLQKEGEIARSARDGFQRGFVWGMLGSALTGFSRGKLKVPATLKRPHERVPTLEEYYRGHISEDELDEIRRSCVAAQRPLRDELMDRMGWPKIEYDGKVLVSHQDALLLGGKVQAAEGYRDHVQFVDAYLCESCGTKVCIEGCSGEAISPSQKGGVPEFDREKCVHCGACVWNCAYARSDDPERSNIEFTAGAGGLHSAEN